MKQPIKIYLEPEDINNLKSKALDKGLTGKGAISHYIEMIAKNEIVFLSRDVKVLLQSLKLNSEQD